MSERERTWINFISNFTPGIAGITVVDLRAAFDAGRSEWVAVEDGYPKDRGFYWVTRGDGRVQKQPFDVNVEPSLGFVVDVTAWMPQQSEPAPYIKEDNDED
jgi:hypothetical protein